MKKIWAVAIVVALGCVLVLGGVVWYAVNGGFDKVQCRYYVEISPQGNSNYTIYIPIAIDKNGLVSEVMSDLRIVNGNAIYEIIDTEQGKALKVVSSESITFEAEVMFTASEKNWQPNTGLAKSKEQFPGNCPGLSMWNETITYTDPLNAGSAWVYCNMTPETGNISLYMYLGTYLHGFMEMHGFKSKVNGVLHDGWQLEDVYRRAMTT